MIPLNQNLTGLRRSQIRQFTNLARQTPGCVMLTIGEPDFSTPDPIKQAAVAALEQDLTHYAPNQGTPALRRAIAAFESRRGHAVTESQVLVTVGACQALFTALLGILNPGDEVIVPIPAFNLYESIITIAGAKMVPLDVAQTDFRITEAALAAAITPRTKAIVINSPNNPTGAIFDRESLENVKHAIQNKPIFLIWDGVYSQLSYADCPDLTLDKDLQDQTILCQSFSKPYAMTGWRLGYLTCPEYVMERLLLLSAATVTAVPTFLQEAAITALDQDCSAMREIYRRRRDHICRRLKEMGLQFPAPEGAFYVFPDIRKFGIPSEEFCRRMICQAGVAAVPGTCFGAEGHIRLSYCCSDEELALGLDRLEAFLNTL